MKKMAIYAIIAFGFTAALSAQGKGDVEFGFNVGYNSASAQTRYFSADFGSGFNAGASAAYYFSRNLSLKTKLLYDQKGWNNDIYVDDAGNEFSADYNLNYITVPVTVNWHFGNTKNWYINAGPYMGFLIDASETSHSTDVSEEFRSTDFGLAIGLGVKIPVSDKLKIFFEYEGQSGLSDIFKGTLNYDVMNTRSAFNVGINFLMQ